MMIKTGSDFSGVGAFDQALIRLGITQKKMFACDMDKYARQTYIYNYGEPQYYPENVYDREIPSDSLDIYMTSPPCQSFSIAGKRKGEDSTNGVLFYNSHEFIVKNNPRYFIFENVKGLLSDNGGKTFKTWIDMLGGKTVNGNPVIFPHEESVPYHVYYQVMNAKHYGVPQNRERIFIIGIRDDADNEFSFPKPFHLVKRLKDVLENEVDEKYFLSDKMIESITYGNKSNGEVANLNKGGERGSVYSEETDAMSCLSATDYKQPKQIQIGTWRTHEDGSGQPVIKIAAIRVRNINGGKIEQQLEVNELGLCNSLTTVQKDNVVVLPPEVYQLNPSLESGGKQPFQQNRIYDIEGVSTTLCRDKADILIVPANNSKGYDIAEEEEEDSINFENPNSETRRGRVGKGVAQTLNTACNQEVLVRTPAPIVEYQLTGGKWDKTHEQSGRVYDKNGIAPTIHTMGGGNQEPKVLNMQRIRRLTPTECFRLMDFNENFKWNVSDSQAYKQAGNSIVVSCLVEIIGRLKL
jgi:DNA (cytosine-5)-methyltransferase 1